MDFLKVGRTRLTKPQKLTLYFFADSASALLINNGIHLVVVFSFLQLEQYLKVDPPAPPHDHKDKV